MHAPIKESGFTLIELVVVIGVLGILASIGIPAFIGFVDEARYQSAKAQLINCRRGCLANPNSPPLLASLPGVDVSTVSTCKDTAFARIGSNCCLSLNLANGSKNEDAGWALNFSGCTDCDVCKNDPNISSDGYIKDMGSFNAKYKGNIAYGGITTNFGRRVDWNHKWCSCERPCDQFGQYRTLTLERPDPSISAADWIEVYSELTPFCEETGYAKGVYC